MGSCFVLLFAKLRVSGRLLHRYCHLSIHTESQTAREIEIRPAVLQQKLNLSSLVKVIITFRLSEMNAFSWQMSSFFKRFGDLEEEGRRLSTGALRRASPRPARRAPRHGPASSARPGPPRQAGRYVFANFYSNFWLIVGKL